MDFLRPYGDLDDGIETGNDAQKAFRKPACRRIAFAVLTADHSNRNRKGPVCDRAVPYLMAALALADEVAPCLAQQLSQFAVEMRSHSGDRRLCFAQRGDLQINR